MAALETMELERRERITLAADWMQLVVKEGIQPGRTN